MLLKAMIKEEWRIHSTLFGSFLFASFPVILLVFSFIGSLFIPVFLLIVPGRTMALMAHYIFVMFGVSVGAFGLFGREVMNRRFGQASLLAYSSRTLPVSERSIFLDFFIKDIIFYFILWILPITAGIGLALPLIQINFNAFLALLTLTLSFLLGLSATFFLSTIYAHSSRAFLAIFILILLVLATGFNLSLFSLPSLSLFYFPTAEKLYSNLVLIIVPSSLSLFFLKVEYPQKKRQFKNSLDPLSGSIGTKYSQFIAKDFLDLQRSEGGMGKIIFSFLFPLLILWFLLYIFLKFLPNANFLVSFSLFLGIISSSIYNWLTEFDLFSTYAFLPVKVSSVMKSKLISYAIINTISVAILLVATFFSGYLVFLLPAFLTFLTVSSYTLAITVYLTGLYPNVLLYNAKNFALYVLLITPVLLVMIFVSILNPFYLVLSPLILPVSFLIIRKSFKKWNSWEGPVF